MALSQERNRLYYESHIPEGKREAQDEMSPQSAPFIEDYEEENVSPERMDDYQEVLSPEQLDQHPVVDDHPLNLVISEPVREQDDVNFPRTEFTVTFDQADNRTRHWFQVLANGDQHQSPAERSLQRGDDGRVRLEGSISVLLRTLQDTIHTVVDMYRARGLIPPNRPPRAPYHLYATINLFYREAEFSQFTRQILFSYANGQVLDRNAYNILVALHKILQSDAWPQRIVIRFSMLRRDAMDAKAGAGGTAKYSISRNRTKKPGYKPPPGRHKTQQELYAIYDDRRFVYNFNYTFGFCTELCILAQICRENKINVRLLFKRHLEPEGKTKFVRMADTNTIRMVKAMRTMAGLPLDVEALDIAESLSRYEQVLGRRFIVHHLKHFKNDHVILADGTVSYKRLVRGPPIYKTLPDTHIPIIADTVLLDYRGDKKEFGPDIKINPLSTQAFVHLIWDEDTNHMLWFKGVNIGMCYGPCFKWCNWCGLVNRAHKCLDGKVPEKQSRDCIVCKAPFTHKDPEMDRCFSCLHGYFEVERQYFGDNMRKRPTKNASHTHIMADIETAVRGDWKSRGVDDPDNNRFYVTHFSAMVYNKIMVCDSDQINEEKNTISITCSNGVHEPVITYEFPITKKIKRSNVNQSIQYYVDFAVHECDNPEYQKKPSNYFSMGYNPVGGAHFTDYADFIIAHFMVWVSEMEVTRVPWLGKYVTVWFHNGARFDMRFLLDYLVKHKHYGAEENLDIEVPDQNNEGKTITLTIPKVPVRIDTPVLMRGSSIIKLRVVFYEHDPARKLTCDFQDTYLIFGSPLRSLGELEYRDACTEAKKNNKPPPQPLLKGYFPHRITPPRSDNVTVTRDDFVADMSEKEKKAFDEEYKNVEWPHPFAYYQKLKEYCDADVDVLRRFIHRARKLFLNSDTLCNIDFLNYPTIAALSQAIMFHSNRFNHRHPLFSPDLNKLRSSRTTGCISSSETLSVVSVLLPLIAQDANGDVRTAFNGLGQKTLPLNFKPIIDKINEEHNSTTSSHITSSLAHPDIYWRDGLSGMHVLDYFNCWWHGCPQCHAGNPELEPDLRTPQQIQRYSYTMMRIEAMQRMGIKVHTLWSHDINEVTEAELEEAQRKIAAMDPDVPECHLTWNDFVGFPALIKQTMRLMSPERKWEIEGIEPRNAYRGGIVFSACLNASVFNTDHWQLIQMDANSMYPSVMASPKSFFPVGYPVSLELPRDSSKWGNYEWVRWWKRSKPFGLVKAIVSPPHECIVPFLFHRVGTGSSSEWVRSLCQKCAEENHSDRRTFADLKEHNRIPTHFCEHSDEERQLRVVCSTVDLEFAFKLGYRIVRVVQVLHFHHRSNSLFNSFVTSLYNERLKADSLVYKDSIKRCLCSGYGRFGKRDDYDVQAFLSDMREFQREWERGRFIYDDSKTSYKFYGPPNASTMLLTRSTREENISAERWANVFVALFVTAYSRIRLVERVVALKDKGGIPLYGDTDSVIGLYPRSVHIPLSCLSDDGAMKPRGQQGPFPVGKNLDQWKNEIVSLKASDPSHPMDPKFEGVYEERDPAWDPEERPATVVRFFSTGPKEKSLVWGWPGNTPPKSYRFTNWDQKEDGKEIKSGYPIVHNKTTFKGFSADHHKELHDAMANAYEKIRKGERVDLKIWEMQFKSTIISVARIQMEKRFVARFWGVIIDDGCYRTCSDYAYLPVYPIGHKKPWIVHHPGWWSYEEIETRWRLAIGDQSCLPPEQQNLQYADDGDEEDEESKQLDELLDEATEEHEKNRVPYELKYTPASEDQDPEQDSLVCDEKLVPIPSSSAFVSIGSVLDSDEDEEEQDEGDNETLDGYHTGGTGDTEIVEETPPPTDEEEAQE